MIFLVIVLRQLVDVAIAWRGLGLVRLVLAGLVPLSCLGAGSLLGWVHAIEKPYCRCENTVRNQLQILASSTST